MSEILDYQSVFLELKEKILSSQYKAVQSVNKALVLLYWEIGNFIVQHQSRKGWGAKIIDVLSNDLKVAFPLMKGFSVRNLQYMRQFAVSYPDVEFVQGVLAQLSWYHNLTIMQKLKNGEICGFYIEKAIDNGWSQKDPYIFDFLLLSEKAKERDIEEQLVHHITKFLLELGAGFAFVGNQYKLKIEDKEYYIDLLFYHLKLKCYFVIELKSVAFKPEFAGKLNFYLSAVDDLVKSETDNPNYRTYLV